MTASRQERIRNRTPERTRGITDELAAEYVALARDSGRRIEEDGEGESEGLMPLHEILQGCIWRDAESVRQKSGLLEAEGDDFGLAEPDRWKELDFSTERRGARGFLDEDPPLFSAGEERGRGGGAAD